MSVHEERTAPLDGNAAGGLLRDLFAVDMTAAVVTCAGCGATEEIGEAKLYGAAMGAIFRCAHCDSVVMRLARTPVGLWLDMRGSLNVLVRPS